MIIIVGIIVLVLLLSIVVIIIVVVVVVVVVLLPIVVVICTDTHASMHMFSYVYADRASLHHYRNIPEARCFSGQRFRVRELIGASAGLAEVCRRLRRLHEELFGASGVKNSCIRDTFEDCMHALLGVRLRYPSLTASGISVHVSDGLASSFGMSRA